MKNKIIEAYDTTNIEEFLSLTFPEEWSGIAARILESGATFSTDAVKWAPRWSPIPMTQRTDNADSITALKSVMFRVHDCLHQLWGLPHPGADFSDDDFYYYKRSQMCGEVAVLTIVEFHYAQYVYSQEPSYRNFLMTRNALPLLSGPLKGKTLIQLTQRLDELLHKKRRPKWVRENPHATAFVDDYVPMLQKDRDQVDHNWALMKKCGFSPDGAPNVRYGRNMDGLELTTWMIEDFNHLKSTDHEVDRELMMFNRHRRSKIKLPDGWDS